MTTKFSFLVLFCVAMVLTAFSKTAEAEYLRKQAEQGDAHAQHAVGVRYALGIGGYPKDQREALKWFLLAAKQGNASAQSWLGDIYAAGEAVPKDDAEAIKWYRLSAEQGDAMSQLNLGVMYDNGRGVQKDLVLAYKWYNLSASQGNRTASLYLGTIEKEMTRSQIEEAQRLSREWFAKNQK